MQEGYLIVSVYSDTIANPISNATVRVLKDGRNIITVTTDQDGKTSSIPLNTVSKEYSEVNQDKVRPYETYDVEVEALGLTPTKIEGVSIFPGITSFQDIYLTSIDEKETETISKIDSNTLWGNYPEQVKEEESGNEGITPYILLRVEVPQTITVHDGTPSNTSAPNYVVNFTDYIKNVASSEIYSTWPESTLRANILAIISFTLNRIFTEWYPSKGYNFTITSTTSYDQKYTKNQTIYEPISRIVDEIFNQYIREGIRLEPLLAHYKSDTTEQGYMSQWGSKYLGDKGYTAPQILKFYYGSNVDISEGTVVEEYPTSFSGDLAPGTCSESVYFIQNQLNYIKSSFPGLPIIENPSGLFNSETEATVRKFQSVFNLPVTGTVDFATWYKISQIFTAVANLTNSIYR